MSSPEKQAVRILFQYQVMFSILQDDCQQCTTEEYIHLPHDEASSSSSASGLHTVTGVVQEGPVGGAPLLFLGSESFDPAARLNTEEVKRTHVQCYVINYRNKIPAYS